MNDSTQSENPLEKEIEEEGEVQEAETRPAPEAPLVNMNLAAALDGLLFVHNRPISFDRLSELLQIPRHEIEGFVLERKQVLDADEQKGLQIIITEDGVQMATKACISQVIQRLEGQKLVSLSLPALETLSVIAFKQPITKAEIESIRGVNCDGVISTLLEKKLVFVSGEKPVIGRPRLYSTTQDFLYYFGMKTLKELPIPALDIPAGTVLPPLPAPEGVTLEGETAAPEAQQATEGQPTAETEKPNAGQTANDGQATTEGPVGTGKTTDPAAEFSPFKDGELPV